ncbi:MAG: alpha-1,6-glucosidase domain-containing protein, partial [Bacteroidota bacterium]
VLTSQGVSFLHAGVEMCRTKGGDHNSYKSADSINALDWSRKALYSTNYEYYRGLIAIRKSHPAFRMESAEAISKNLKFIEVDRPGAVVYELNGAAVGDDWKRIIVAFNGKPAAMPIDLPNGRWCAAVFGDKVDPEASGSLGCATYKFLVPGRSALVFVQK